MKNKFNLLTGVVLGFTLLLNSQNTNSQTNTNYGTEAGNGGLNNSCFGYSAGDSVTGRDNSFFGANAGRSNTSGTANCIFGAWSGTSNTTGDNNSFYGYASGIYNSTGEFNSFFGQWSGVHNKTGRWNTYIGSSSGFKNKTGMKNTFIGSNAGYKNTGSANVFIGYNAGYNETDSNKLYIDNSSTSEPLIWGDFDSNVLRINGKLETDEMEVISLLASKVNVNMPHLADYVFSSDYKLRSLKEVENFIEQNNRLPEMPSASEVKEKGLDIGEMNNLLLQKIEELTLYIIEQDKRIEELENNK